MIRKNVIFFVENYSGGGVDRYLSNMIDVLKQAHGITIVSNKTFRPPVNSAGTYFSSIKLNIKTTEFLLGRYNGLLNKLLSYIVYNTPFWFYLLNRHFKNQNCITFENSIDFSKYDIAIAINGGFPGSVASYDFLRLAKSFNCKTTLVVLSMPDLKSRYFDFLSGINSFIDGIIVNSDTIESKLKEISQIKNLPIYSLKQYVSRGQYDLKIDNSNSQRFVIGYFGRISKSKGVLVLIEAFKKLQKAYPNLELYLYGNNQLDCIDKIRYTTYFNSQIKFMGNYSSLSFINDFDVFVLPSFWEGFPYTILEAMSFGKPVIASNVGGIPEIIENDFSGILIKPADVDDLISKLELLINSYEKRKLYGDNGQKVVSENFSFDRFKSGLESILFINER